MQEKKKNGIGSRTLDSLGEFRVLFYDYKPEHFFNAKYFSVTGYFCFFAPDKKSYPIRTEFIIKEFRDNSPLLDYETICYN